MTSLKYETYYLLYDDNKGCPSHTILVFYDKNKVYWFEPMFNDKNCFYSGINEYDNITKLLEDFKHNFIKSAVINELIPIDYNPSNIQIYKYTIPYYGEDFSGIATSFAYKTIIVTLAGINI